MMAQAGISRPVAPPGQKGQRPVLPSSLDSSEAGIPLSCPGLFSFCLSRAVLSFFFLAASMNQYVTCMINLVTLSNNSIARMHPGSQETMH